MSVYCIIIGLIPLIYSVFIFAGQFKRERSKNKKGAFWRTIKYIFTNGGPHVPGSGSNSGSNSGGGFPW